MKGLFKHFLLCTLLIFHTSFGSVMAAQMQTSHMKMGSPDLVLSDVAVATVDVISNVGGTMVKPCPHHANNSKNNAIDNASTTTQINHSMTQCSGHDCSNCNCVNALSSIPAVTLSFDYLEIDRSNTASFIASIFPDSPTSFILRPPKS